MAVTAVLSCVDVVMVIVAKTSLQYQLRKRNRSRGTRWWRLGLQKMMTRKDHQIHTYCRSLRSTLHLVLMLRHLTFSCSAPPHDIHFVSPALFIFVNWSIYHVCAVYTFDILLVSFHVGLYILRVWNHTVSYLKIWWLRSCSLCIGPNCYGLSTGWLSNPPWKWELLLIFAKWTVEVFNCYRL